MTPTTVRAAQYADGDFMRYADIRAYSDSLVSGLTEQEQCVQSMASASPLKWHRAHTTWFFEQFVLRRFIAGYKFFDAGYGYLFNSYYDSVGPQHPQETRGRINRPDVAEIEEYRRHVDGLIAYLLEAPHDELCGILEIGLQHEQQHQELMVTDFLDAAARNDSVSAILPSWIELTGANEPTRFITFSGGLAEIGHAGLGFSFDNEMPRHNVYLHPYQLASRLVRNSTWMKFIADGGYGTSTLWMSDGWDVASREKWLAPLHWRRVDGDWYQAGPNGLRPVNPSAPVRHISWYEADAFARWSGARLPAEAEWECAADMPGIHEMTGHVWQWTASAYHPYPKYRPAAGALGEYNGKFMINQMVLRGSSSVTPPGHARSTYRNFFRPEQRWQFSGLRLAHDVE